MYYVIPQRPSFDLTTRNLNISNPTATQAFGIIDSNGDPLGSAFHYRGGKCLTDAAALKKRYDEAKGFEQLSGKWFYGGILFSHFGHFLTESIHRLRSYLKDPTPYDGVIFLKSPQAGTFSYDPLKFSYIESVFSDYLGIDKSKLLVTDSYLAVEDMVCMPQEQQLGVAPSPDYLEFLGELEGRLILGAEKVDSVENIFLSRRKYLGLAEHSAWARLRMSLQRTIS